MSCMVHWLPSARLAPYRSTSPAMKASVRRCASWSVNCSRRALHEVAGRAGQRAADAAVECELGAAHRVDDDAGGVGRVPHFELQFAVQRHVAEGRAFHADVAPFPVGEPRHVVARADMRVRASKARRAGWSPARVLDSFFDSRRSRSSMFMEVGVAAEIELVGAVEPHAALAEQVGEHRCMMVAPTWLLMSSPISGSRLARSARHSGSEAIKTGMQLTKAHPAARACSAYQRVAFSAPTGR